jgi:hypothetical protein
VTYLQALYLKAFTYKMSAQEETVLGLQNLANQCRLDSIFIAPTIHGNKLVSIGVTVNFDTRKVELLLRGRKLQSSTEHIKKILPRNSTKVRSVKKSRISIESSRN